MRILHLLDDLDSRDGARQVQLLAPAFQGGAASIGVCCLGAETPQATILRGAGIRVHTLGWTRWLDVGALWNLRALVRDARPDVIHVWSLPALRMLAASSHASLGRTVFSAVLPAKGPLAWYDRWLLRQVGGIAVAAGCDRQRILPHAGVVHLVPPAVAAFSCPGESARPDATFSILYAAPLEREAGAQIAVWTFDIVRYLFPDARLHLVGLGSQESNLRRLANGLQNDAIHFMGDLADRAAWMQTADLVWVPSLGDCGRQTALEAMAEGRAVIAANVPCLAELISDGATGLLVPPGDVVALARRTRLLREDAALRQRIGHAAREFVRQRFPLQDTVARWQEVYRRIAA